MRRGVVTIFAIIAGAAAGGGLAADAIYIHKQYAFVLFFFVPLATGFAAVATLRAILGRDSVPPPTDWIYRAGLACPQRTRIIRPGAGGERRCELSTGELVERIDVWEPGRRLQWTSLSTPPPIREINPFYDVVDAPHLKGYYTSPRGEFVLERVGPHRTRLTRRTWYSQRLYPAMYWRLWSEMGISHIHDTVLQQVSRGAMAKG